MRVQFKYKNHRGEVEDRDVEIDQLGFDFLPRAEMGYQPGWFIGGWDYSRGRDGVEYRTFFLSNMIINNISNMIINNIGKYRHVFTLIEFPADNRPEEQK
jgi:hypothetical protein